jgi:Zn-dependent metalloprotease
MSRQLLTVLVASAAGTSFAIAPAAVGTGGVVQAGAPLVAPAPAHKLAEAQHAADMARARAEADSTAESLGLSARERLLVKDVVRDADGTLHVRYDRTYSGHPVVAGDLVVHTAANGRRTVDWASDAVLSAAGAPRARTGAPTAAATAGRTSNLTPVRSAPRLVLDTLGARPRWAWQVQVDGWTPGGEFSREAVYVDAATGRGLHTLDLTPQANGRGNSLYSGRVRLITARTRSGFALRDIRRGNGQVRDMHNTNVFGRRGTLFVDRDNLWGNGRPANRQSAAVDAAYGAAATWDYFRSQHRRAGIRNNRRGVVSRVHFGRRLDNAFWSDACFCMTYGDGGRAFRQVVSLDVAAHEMAHGITSVTAGLIGLGEPFALNEATSDIFAALVEFHTANPRDRGDYLIGEKVVRRGAFLRRLDRPTADGNSLGCYADDIGLLDEHFSSGVGNHFFYLLAEGSGAKVINRVRYNSPTCNGSRFPGIGRTAAGRIWYRALTVYMTSTTNYTDAHDATIRAARDLFGARSARCAAVARAWEAVSVPAGDHTCTAAPEALGPNAVANAGFEAGATGWTAPRSVIARSPNTIPHAGRWSAVLGGRGPGTTDTLRQQVTVPAGSARLRFQLLVGTNQTGTTPVDTLTVEVVNSVGAATEIDRVSNLDATNTYHRRSHDLGAFAGQSVTLRFTSTVDASVLTLFFVDDVFVTPN